MWAILPLALYVASNLVGKSSAQTFQRLGACPTLGCVFPPDQTDFLAGQYFDVRLEVHAPTNGTEAFNHGKPDENFTFSIQKEDGPWIDGSKFFNIEEPKLETWNFTWFEDMFAADAGTPTVVNVASKAYRALRLTTPGDYKAKLQYYNGQQTVANWTVREPAKKRTAKNVLFFIGDGMTVSMVTAARLLGHKSINGKYQSLLQLDQMEALGHQMTHSIDSFITDSANSATALYSGKKSTVNALNVWVDSSDDELDDPKVETIAELFRRVNGGPVGIVSTAFIADATPAALCSHTPNRDFATAVVYEYLNSAQELTPSIKWPTSCVQPDVIFGGGAEQFIPGTGSPNGTDFYKAFEAKGYNVVYNKTQLLDTPNDQPTLGIFCKSVMAKWVDRNVFPENLRGLGDSPTGDGTDATDQPGLKEMTLKAIDILHERSKENNTGWFMMSEAASIDKMMHVLDYERGLGELLDLDDTISASMQRLKELGELEDTLIVITADHGHGFDVYGSSDTEYLVKQSDDRHKRNAIGVYHSSGLSGYMVSNDSLPSNNSLVVGPQGPHFPVNWYPRYAIAAGFAANPDHRETFSMSPNGPRLPAVTASGVNDYHVNPKDNPLGFTIGGSIDIGEPQGVHSLTDVPVFASGPGAENFRGVYNSVDIFYKIADALALGRTD